MKKLCIKKLTFTFTYITISFVDPNEFPPLNVPDESGSKLDDQRKGQGRGGQNDNVWNNFRPNSSGKDCVVFIFHVENKSSVRNCRMMTFSNVFSANLLFTAY